MNTPRLCSRADLLQPSPTLAITAKAKAMRAAGVDVIGLAAGEPDFDTPGLVVEAAVAALRSGFTKYSPTSGIPDLKEAIAEKLGRENGVHVHASQVVVSTGAKQSLFNALMNIAGPGDEVVLIAPYWPTYAEQVCICGATPVSVSARFENGFVPDPDDVRAAITGRTRAIVFNSPCNPTGAVFGRELVEALADIAAKNDLWLISDEIYEKLIYEGAHVSVGSLGPEVAERTVTVNGCSKSYAMTGWRIGYCAAPLGLAKKMSDLQDQVTSNANSFAQKGAVEALALDAGVMDEMREEFRARRDMMVAKLRAIEGLRLAVPSGAFYAFVDVSKHLGGSVPTDFDLADHLLEHALVATVPGSVFAAPGHLRISYAASRDDLVRGAERISDALASLRP